MDRDTGEIYLSPDTIRDCYGKEEAVNLLTQLSNQLQPLKRVFFILTFDQAISLWAYELNNDEQKATDRYSH